MRNLIVYYSLEGNTKLIAEMISKEIECDVIELQPKKEYAKGRISKYFGGGRSVLIKEKPDLVNSYKDIKEYDNIFIGTPVWCGTYAPPLNTFLDKCAKDLRNKSIALFACHGGGGADKCFTNFTKALNNSNIVGSIDFKDPLKNDKTEIRVGVKKWISDLKVR